MQQCNTQTKPFKQTSQTTVDYTDHNSPKPSFQTKPITKAKLQLPLKAKDFPITEREIPRYTANGSVPFHYHKRKQNNSNNFFLFFKFPQLHNNFD